ncbi:hypothetical protein LUZ60_003949 [Juncus effusus]|nr:hypothetical protein LUZ60_003949 [Juncus effusus]
MASSFCCANPPSLNPTCGGGSVVDNFGGIKSYIVGSTGSKQAVILISDVYGFEAPLLRKIADKVAESGYFVVVPDFIHGDPFEAEDKGFEEAKPVIAALKEKGINSVGAAGYCWGAKVAIELAKAGEIQAAVLSHPSFVSVGDIRGTKFTTVFTYFSTSPTSYQSERKHYNYNLFLHTNAIPRSSN